MLSPGDTAPEFTLPGVSLDRSTEIRTFRLADALSSSPVLVNFYMFDFNPACRENVCDLHDLAWFDLDDDIRVFGLSTDGAFSHREFARQEDLKYPLLSDTDGSVAAAYGVCRDEFRGHRRIANRAVFLVDTSGRIRYSWSAEDPDDQPEWEAIKAAVEDIK